MNAPKPSPKPAGARADDLTIDLADGEDGSTTLPSRARSAITAKPARFTRGAATGPAHEGKAQQVRLLPGRSVPGTRYRLVRWLGEGGMGVVYEAEHEDIERRFAIKILRHEASEDPAQAARFREEARAASKIGSPNIVQIFDFGELPDGRLMFVMEMLSGHGLDGEVETAPIDQARLVAILRQVCRGLAAAHDVGIVHRDIKPDNIILVAEGSRQDMVKIVDFGIATILTPGTSEVPAAGTPQYMAPEQILGQAVGGALDQYSLGCMAYELITGKPPFFDGGVEEILARHLDTEPKPIGRVAAEGALHPALEAVIMRCLAKDPARRFAGMRDLEAALCEAQIAAGIRTAWDDLPIPEVEPERRAAIIARMPRLDDHVAPRRRWLWPVVAAGSTIVAVALGVVLTMNKPPEPGEEKAVEALYNAALEAGSSMHWVYPPADDPNNTSYRRILELEAMTGSVEDLADEKARELRRKFFYALNTFGDSYWDRPDGKTFAAEYYAWASLFAFDDAGALAIPEEQPAADVAMKRSGLTRPMLARMRRDAAEGTFSAEEIQVGAEMAVLSEPDEKVRSERLAQAETIPVSQKRKLARLAMGKPAVADVDPAAEASGGDAEAADSGGEPGVEPGVAPTAVERGGSASDPPEIKRTATPRDPKQSRKLAADAARALASGNRKEAESLFHQALAHDNRNGAALIGLSDIHFDRSEYTQAVSYAEKAVQASPRNGGYRIRLGDAYFKLLRYADAQGEYEVAKQLGNHEADERLAKVKARLGK